jgi:hypothetical protein
MAANIGRVRRQFSMRQDEMRKYALTFKRVGMGIGVATALALAAGPAGAVGNLGNLDLARRSDGQALPVYVKDGRNWVVGTPGQEYAIRFCNSTGGRVLAVMSVDGVNVVSGDTASPAQSGYVLDAYECTDIQGWRKNLARTAAFYFTELPDAYATRTGRPENVGVIGVAVFRERQEPVAWRDYPGRIANEARRDTQAAKPEAAAGGSVAQDSRAGADVLTREEAGRAAMAPAPAPLSKLGTGHGRSEQSPVQVVRFEREGPVPNETIAIHYDRRENLVTMGVLPPPVIARTPNPFPAWAPRFVPNPPRW